MTTIAILQPSYLPWLGAFDQIKKSDLFVYLDDAQYTKNDWRNRNRIKMQSRVEWLTIPIKTSGRLGQSIARAEIQGDSWRLEHLDKIERAYSNSPYWKDYSPVIQAFLGSTWNYLMDVSLATMYLLVKCLAITTPLVAASSLGASNLRKTDRLIHICKELGATKYLSGDGAKDYLNVDKMQEEGIEVVWQDYQHPVYPQQHGEFVSHLSVVDLLFNCGPRAKEFLCAS